MSYQINQSHFPSVQVNLNSANADAYGGNPTFKSWCYFIFREPIINLPNAYQFLISCNDAQIPVSYYCINSTNNLFEFNANGLYCYITLTPGNYSIYDVAAQLTTNNINAQGNVNFTLLTLYSDVTNTLTFKFTFPTNVNSVVIYASRSKNPIFGFNGVNDIIGSRNEDGDGGPYYLSLQSNSGCDISGTRCVFVKCMNVHTQAYDSKTKYSGNCLSRIPINQEANGIVYWTNATGFKSKCTLKSLSVLEIQIVDENNQFIDFNNIDWSISIQIDVLIGQGDYMPDQPFMNNHHVPMDM